MQDVASLSLRLLADRLDALAQQEPWEPYPWQVPPGAIVTHGMWLIEGGRGIGKTDGCARYVDQHVNGPPCDPRHKGGHRVAIIAPTLDDAAESCVTGPSGLQAHNPAVRLRTMLGGSKAIWPSGAEAKLFSGNDKESVERLRAGGNRCLVWVEEAAAMRYLADVIKQARYGLRLGHRAHLIGSSTPKPTLDYKALRSDPRVVRTHGTTEQAVHLDPAVRASLYADYAGTRLGRQELLGELLDDVEGALWTYALIGEGRADPVDMATVGQPGYVAFWQRRVVALDPSDGTADGDEQGLAVVGLGSNHELYVLASEGLRVTPWDYLNHAVDVAIEHAATLVIEKNHGSEYLIGLLEQVLRKRGIRTPYKVVTANPGRGKMTRAEPVAGLYERGKVHHVGEFPELEAQMTSWTGKTGEKSPDRLDALVWALSEFTGHALTDAPQTAGSAVVDYDGFPANDTDYQASTISGW